MDERAGNGDAAPHAAGEASGIKAEGLLESHEAKRLAHADIDFFVGNFFLDQLVGNVVAHGERIEERAFLKDHSGAGAQREELLLGNLRDLFAEEMNGALSPGRAGHWPA